MHMAAFWVGVEKNKIQLFLTQLNCMKKYIKAKDPNNSHIEFSEGKNPIGKAMFVSLNTHLGYGKDVISM